MLRMVVLKGRSKQWFNLEVMEILQWSVERVGYGIGKTLMPK
jgi:hypothetical protein